jgi:hypothetical protein
MLLCQDEMLLESLLFADIKFDTYECDARMVVNK